MTLSNSPSSSKSPAVKCRVFVVDDHPMFRKAVVDWLKDTPNFKIVGEAGNGREALTTLRKVEADVVVVDISLEGADGIELIKSLRGEQPGIKILVLSMHDENIYAMRALRAGAQGFIMKNVAGDTFLEALRTVASGEIYVSPAFAKTLIYRAVQSDEAGHKNPLSCLSDRELEVFRLIGSGNTSREIAQKLNVSIKTVESHRMHAKEKLGLKNSAELVRFAVSMTQFTT